MFACRTSRHSAFHVHQQERMTQKVIKMSVTLEWRNSIQDENASEKGDVQPILPFSNERWERTVLIARNPISLNNSSHLHADDRRKKDNKKQAKCHDDFFSAAAWNACMQNAKHHAGEATTTQDNAQAYQNKK